MTRTIVRKGTSARMRVIKPAFEASFLHPRTRLYPNNRPRPRNRFLTCETGQFKTVPNAPYLRSAILEHPSSQQHLPRPWRYLADDFSFRQGQDFLFVTFRHHQGHADAHIENLVHFFQGDHTAALD
jgi:hypothetical protein